jgi:organic radical activating enzyme
LTGGEPFDQDLIPFFLENEWAETFHVESSGTKPFVPLLEAIPDRKRLWLCMSPKPGYLEGNIELADEIKVIVPGLGSGAGWPSLKDALKWADEGKKVFLQPRNGRFEVDKVNMSIVKGLVMRYPQLRLSVQLHKILGVQ